MFNQNKKYTHNFLISIVIICTISIIVSNYIMLKKSVLDFENVIIQKEYEKIWWEYNYKLLMEIQKQNLLSELNDFKEKNPIMVSEIEKRLNWETTEVNQKFLTNEEFEVLKKDTYIKWNTWALVTIIDFWDFECEHCIDFHNSWKLKELDLRFKDKLNFIYKNIPIESNEDSKQKSMIARCVYDNFWWEKYFEFLNWMYIRPYLTSSIWEFEYKNYLLEFWINDEKFEECISQEKYNEQIKSEIWQSIYLWIKYLPSIVVVNNQTLSYKVFESDELWEDLEKYIEGIIWV